MCDFSHTQKQINKCKKKKLLGTFEHVKKKMDKDMTSFIHCTTIKRFINLVMNRSMIKINSNNYF